VRENHLAPPRSMIQVIILNLNAPDETGECLRGLSRSDLGDWKAMVIDNGSTDDSAQRLRAENPGLEIVEAGENLGYAAGCNLGIKLSTGKKPSHFFFLNNDARLEPAALRYLLEASRAHPRAGIVGPVILTSLPGEVIESFGMKCGFGSGRFYHRQFRKRMEQLDPRVRSQPVIEADALSGCALLVRRETIEEIGGFDEDYFFYFEDADLCRRAQKAGWQTILVPRAVVRHKGSTTIMGIDPALRVYYGVRNQLLLFNRNEPLENPVSRWLRNFNVIFLTLAYLFKSSQPSWLRAFAGWWRGVRDYFGKRLGKAGGWKV